MFQLVSTNEVGQNFHTITLFSYKARARTHARTHTHIYTHTYNKAIGSQNSRDVSWFTQTMLREGKAKPQLR